MGIAINSILAAAGISPALAIAIAFGAIIGLIAHSIYSNI